MIFYILLIILMIVTEIQVDIIPYWEIKIIFSFLCIMYCLANVNNRIMIKMPSSADWGIDILLRY